MPMHREWVDLFFTGVGIAAGAAIVPLDILFDMRDEVNKTVARLILDITVMHSNLSTNEEASTRLNIGIGVATQEGFDGGAGTVPSPNVSTEFPIHGWLWRAQYGCYWSNSATFGIELALFPRIAMDLRASRKVDKGVLYLAATNTLIQTGFALELTGSVRALMLTG